MAEQGAGHRSHPDPRRDAPDRRARAAVTGAGRGGASGRPEPDPGRFKLRPDGGKAEAVRTMSNAKGLMPNGCAWRRVLVAIGIMHLALGIPAASAQYPAG